MASIDLLALRQNLQRWCVSASPRVARCLWGAGGSRPTPTGHGVCARVWSAFSARRFDGFALLNLEEAILLREQGWKGPILPAGGLLPMPE